VGAISSARYAKSIATRTLKDLLCGSESMNYGSMMYVYGWKIEEHQTTGIDYQQIRDV